ncbi:MAG TPA: hypothetical protein VII20_12515 [Roseiarcus sp.]|jgi:hypothetical protein
MAGGNFTAANALLRQNAFRRENSMARFNWHAEYFDDLDFGRCVRRTTIDADNASEAERIATAEMGPFARVEVRRAGTPAPGRIIYARRAPARLPRTDAFSMAALTPATH